MFMGYKKYVLDLKITLIQNKTHMLPVIVLNYKDY
jgi:hypothetical protein